MGHQLLDLKDRTGVVVTGDIEALGRKSLAVNGRRIADKIAGD
jgi:hypothetical protein